MPKHLFFDLDKTLTKSRSPIEPAHQELFDALCRTHDVIVVSGGSELQIREQVTPRFDGMYVSMPQSGNQAIGKDGNELWNEPLTPEQVTATMTFIDQLKGYFGIAVKDESDLVENRGAQISYSVIGFHEDIEKKYAFDPDDSKRQAALRALTTEREALSKADMEVTPAGTTVYNFIRSGRHKGFNVARLLELEHWDKDDCIYIGDALFPGGNDETVIGVIPTQAVANPDETFALISKMLS